MLLPGAHDADQSVPGNEGFRGTGSLRRRAVQIVAQVVQIRCPSRLTCPLMSDEASTPAAVARLMRLHAQ
jgi:hypothetical protein